MIASFNLYTTTSTTYINIHTVSHSCILDMLILMWLFYNFNKIPCKKKLEPENLQYYCGAFLIPLYLLLLRTEPLLIRLKSNFKGIDPYFL